MISVEEALERILSNVHVLEAEKKPILACLGQVLSESVMSGMDVPPHDNSAMDGYAVRAGDISQAANNKPVILKIIGEVAAGYVCHKKVVKGSAVRIMTGAPVPDGADTIVQFEHTDELERKIPGKKLKEIGMLQPAGKGLNIRRKGEDIRKGQKVLSKGTVLKAAEIGVLASLGNASVKVIRRPVISILSTGDELCDINEPLAPGKIYNSNTYSIAASVLSCGGIPKIIGIGRDSMRSLSVKIKKSLDADMLITSGGVSKGDYDVVKDVLAEMGEIGFWTVRMKPGKPLAFGMIRKNADKKSKGIPHLGLPGNPTSSMITFEQFARPAILKMMGKTQFRRPVVKARIDSTIKNDDGRRIFARVQVSRTNNGYKAALTGPQGSGILMSMVMANGLAIIPEDCPAVKPGDEVIVQLLDYEGEII